MAKRDNSHYRVQRQGKIRDHNICQVCGSTIAPEGHHIIDYQYGVNITVRQSRQSGVARATCPD